MSTVAVAEVPWPMTVCDMPFLELCIDFEKVTRGSEDVQTLLMVETDDMNPVPDTTMITVSCSHILLYLF